MRRSALPPNLRVMTEADVAVGQMIHSASPSMSAIDSAP